MLIILDVEQSTEKLEKYFIKTYEDWSLPVRRA
jgi:hypothetical protein